MLFFCWFDAHGRQLLVYTPIICRLFRKLFTNTCRRIRNRQRTPPKRFRNSEPAEGNSVNGCLHSGVMIPTYIKSSLLIKCKYQWATLFLCFCIASYSQYAPRSWVPWRGGCLDLDHETEMQSVFEEQLIFHSNQGVNAVSLLSLETQSGLGQSSWTYFHSAVISGDESPGFEGWVETWEISFCEGEARNHTSFFKWIHANCAAFCVTQLESGIVMCRREPRFIAQIQHQFARAVTLSVIPQL